MGLVLRDRAAKSTHQRNRRWCSDSFEIGCDNGEKVQVAFALDCCDREAMSFLATTGGIRGEDVRDLMVTAVEHLVRQDQSPASHHRMALRGVALGRENAPAGFLAAPKASGQRTRARGPWHAAPRSAAAVCAMLILFMQTVD